VVWRRSPCSSGTARAATLDGIEGQVLVNRGGGYKRVRGPVVLKAGDTIVVANRGGRAVVSYDDGCNVPVEFSSAVVAAAAGPSACAAQASYKAPAGVTGSPGVPAPGGMDGTTLAVGAVVVGGAIGAAVLLSRDQKRDRPASP
jgi:hypothetical protein